MDTYRQIRAAIQEFKIELEVEKLKAKVFEKMIVEGSATEIKFSETFFNHHVKAYEQIIREQLKLEEQIKALEDRLPENH